MTLEVSWRIKNVLNGLFCLMESYDLKNLGGGGDWEENMCLIALFRSRIK